MPVVNEARATQIRKAIADGTYKAEPEKITDSLLRHEHEMTKAIPPRK